MIGGLVDAIQQALTSPAQRVLATVLVIAALVALSAVVWQIGLAIRERYDVDSLVLELAQAALVVAFAVAAIAGVVVIWRATDEARVLVDAVSADTQTLVRALISLFLVVGAWGLTRFVWRVIDALSARRDAFSRHQVEVGYHVAQVTIYLLAILTVFTVWGINLGNLLLGAGFLGVVLGLAARQTLAAVLAGFVLLFSRPFDIGDWIAVADREGIVTDVTIFNTEIRTFSDESVTIPNDVVTSASIVNRSRRGQLRVDIEVGVDYEDDLERARAVAERTLTDLDCETIAEHPDPVVVGKRFGDSAVVLELRFWIDDPTAQRRWAAQTAVITAVKDAFEDAGLTIPFPQRSLSNRAGGTREPSSDRNPSNQADSQVDGGGS